MPSPEYILEQARLIHMSGDPARAIPMYQQGLARRPALAPAHFMLGEALAESGRPAAAAESLRKAVALAPGQIEFRTRLARVERILGNFDAALAVWMSAIKQHPERVDLRLALAEEQVSLHRSQDAIATLDDVLRLAHAHPGASTALGSLYERVGRLEDARRVAQAGLDAPSSNAATVQAPLRLVLSRVAGRSGNQPEQERLLNSIIETASTSVSGGLAMLDLGAALESAGHCEAAFHMYTRGKQTLKSLLPPTQQDPAPFLNMIADARLALTAADVAAWPSRSTDSSSPVFLCGFPRSGTTLLEVMLGSHPALCMTDELPLVQHVRDTLQESFAGRLNYPRWVNELTPRHLDRATDSYMKRARWLTGAALDGRRLLDKQPLNIINLPLIRRLFPTSPIIVMTRDPRDTCLSCFSQPMMHIPAFYSLRDTAQLYSAVTELWLHYRAVLPGPFIEVRYEELVRDPAGQARSIVEGLGLPWDPAVLQHEHIAGGRLITTPSYRQAARPVYTTAVSRWQRFTRPIQAIEPELRSSLDSLGYS